VLRRDLGEELARLNTSTVNTQNGVYELYYENPEDVNLLLEIINDKSTPVYKLSACKKQNLVEIVSRAELGKVRYLYEKLRYYMERVTGETWGVRSLAGIPTDRIRPPSTPPTLKEGETQYYNL